MNERQGAETHLRHEHPSYLGCSIEQHKQVSSASAVVCHISLHSLCRGRRRHDEFVSIDGIKSNEKAGR